MCVAVHVQDHINGQVLHPLVFVVGDEIPEPPLQYVLHQLGLPAVVVIIGLEGPNGELTDVLLVAPVAPLPVGGDAELAAGDHREEV